VFVTQEALADQKVINNLTVIDNGEDAMRYLRREAGYTNAERPDLVILDLNLPRLSGGEVLAEIKGDPELATIPVVILTTSAAEQDVLESYKQHANAYVTKPVDFESFRQIVQQIDDFFISVVRRPTGQSALRNP
jgi:CheY-like chemotaxis protein